jgi:glycine cleavage system aminomethyltransferase T
MTLATAPLSRTPLHHWHAAHGAQFVERDGWLVPAVYSGVEQELAAARTGLALADVSAFAKVSLLGPGVVEAAEHLAGAGRAVRPCTAAPLHRGGPGLACRLTTDHLLLLASTTATAPLTEALAHGRPAPALLERDVTSNHAQFWLLGRRIEDVLRRLTSLPPTALAAPGACAETNLAGVHALLIPSPELTVPSLRVCVSWDLGEYVWESVAEQGQELGIVPCGLGTLALLRGGDNDQEPPAG